MSKDKKNDVIEVAALRKSEDDSDVELSPESAQKSADTKEEIDKLSKELVQVQKDLAILADVETTGKDLVVVSDTDPLKAYLREIAKYELLSPDQEYELAKQLQETGDLDVARKLVVANLRLVVKIAMEYRSAYKNVLDLIQEGNIGLMKAVSKYDPDKGAKLSYYSSWWIRSYILKFILDNFRLVKLGSTNEQKKLFYNLMREKERLESQGIKAEPKLLAQNLDVSEKAVIDMSQKLITGGEYSIDASLDDETSASLGDFLSSGDDFVEELETQQGVDILNENLREFVEGLKQRDKEIFKKRLLSDAPLSLQAIGDEYGISRERVRQIESRLMEQLKVYMQEHIR